MSVRAIVHLARADFLERARRYSFLLTLAGTVYAGWLVDAGYVRLAVADRRGVLDSAWVGTLLALFLATMLPLVGFYLVKNTLERDRETGVGEILATTPVSRLAYVLGKVASNALLLGVIVAAMAVAGVVLQLRSDEDGRLDLVALVVPLVGLAMPPLVAVAAIAVLFESVRWLRGTLGNVVWFFLWAAGLGTALQSPVLDPAGVQMVKRSVLAQITQKSASGAPRDGFSFTIGPPSAADLRLPTFRWDGLEWTGGVIAQRLGLVAAAFAIALLAALLFGRFDPAREGRRPAARAAATSTKERRRRLPAWSPRSPFLALVVAELRLMLVGRHRLWQLAALGLAIAGAVAPLAAARSFLLPIAWLWPIALWSGMGAREERFGTRPLVASGGFPAWSHAAAIWTAGVVVAALAGGPVGARLAATGDGAALLAWLGGCLFVPSLALALGTWSGSTRPFELVYLVLWYVGPMNRVPALDYAGATPGAAPVVWLIAAGALLAAAVAGRVRWAHA